MVSAGAAMGIALVALGLVITPGPNVIYLVSRSVTQGRRAGLVSLLGVATGYVAYLAAATAGLTAIFFVVPATFTALKLAGAAYFLFLAWQAVRPGGRSAFEPAGLPEIAPRRLYAMGLLTNLLNPKNAVLYIALLPQFIDHTKGGVVLQGLILGLIQIGVAITVHVFFVLGAGSLSTFLSSRPSWLRAQRYVIGVVLGVLAVRLAIDWSSIALAFRLASELSANGI
jgi:threonine/homoserine/homoserine lactone efflux protein